MSASAIAFLLLALGIGVHYAVRRVKQGRPHFNAELRKLVERNGTGILLRSVVVTNRGLFDVLVHKNSVILVERSESIPIGTLETLSSITIGVLPMGFGPEHFNSKGDPVMVDHPKDGYLRLRAYVRSRAVLVGDDFESPEALLTVRIALGMSTAEWHVHTARAGIAPSIFDPSMLRKA